MATEENSGGVVVSAVGKPSGGPLKIKRLPKLKYAAVALVLLVIVAGAVLYVAHANQEKKKKAEAVVNYPKVKSLVFSGDCSAGAQASVSMEQPTPLPKQGSTLTTEQINSSISLLAYHELCLLEAGKYQDANKVIEQKIAYYKLKGDVADIANANRQIAQDDQAIAAESSGSNNTGTAK